LIFADGSAEGAAEDGLDELAFAEVVEARNSARESGLARMGEKLEPPAEVSLVSMPSRV